MKLISRLLLVTSQAIFVELNQPKLILFGNCERLEFNVICTIDMIGSRLL